MLELYVEALLADKDLADQVWELWNAGVITDGMAAWAWWLCIIGPILPDDRLGNKIDNPVPGPGKGWIR